MLNIRTILKALKILPKASTEISAQGEMEVLTSDGKLRYHDGSSISPVVTEAHSATLTNKSIDADSNTITNIDNNDIKAAAGIVDTKLATISTAGKVSNSATTATDANTASAIVARDASGNFSAGTITAALSGNATTATTATNFSGSLAGDVSGTQGATVVDTVGGKTDTEIATSVTDTQAATSSNTVSTIVKRDASGNFSAGTITAALSGNATTATTATNVSGTVAIANGGTGQTSQTAAFDALAPTTTAGDLITHNGTDNIRLPVGSSGQVLKVVGGAPSWSTFSGGINYLSGNPDAESDTSGWATYADAAGSQPVNGTGGSPTVTWTRTTSSPLRGSASFLFTKDAANRQGEGASYDFTIDSTDQAKVLTVSFDYAVASGTYATGDLTVYLYDVTNALVIQPTGYQIESASTGLGMKHVATFQTASNSTSYRLILHVASTSASAYTVKCDNFAVSPQVITQGTPVTDWQSFTMTIRGATSNPTKGTVATDNAYWRRVGDTMELRYEYRQTASGSDGSGSYLFTLPNGLSIDPAKIGIGSSGYYQDLGDASVYNGSLPVQDAHVAYGDATSVRIYIPATNQDVSSSAYALGNITVTYAFEAKVPILGWSSQVQMSSDTDTRVVAMKAYQASHHTLATGSATKINFSTTTVDTVGAFDAANNRYSVKVSGTYRIYAKLLFDTSASGSRTVQIFKNSTRIAEEQHPATGYTYVSVSTIVDASAGDTFEIKGMQDSGGNLACGFDGGDQTQSAFEVERISGPSQIAASEKIRAKYRTSVGNVASSTTQPFNFDTKVYDSHGAVTASAAGTGSWRFTAPRADYYKISATAYSSVTANMSIYKNGSLYENMGGINASIGPASGKTEIYLLAGEYFDMRFSSSGNSGGFTGNDNHIEISAGGAD